MVISTNLTLLELLTKPFLVALEFCSPKYSLLQFDLDEHELFSSNFPAYFKIP